MTTLINAHPRITVRLFKTIARKTIDGQSAVSVRYEEKDEYIDLTPYLNIGSSVRTTKSVREPAGGFVITFADKPQKQFWSEDLETIYGLVEPMDVVEIRMWGGTGAAPAGDYPIVMRGYVSDVRRAQTVGQDGKPQRQVVISGQDYGKIWQVFQVIHLTAYIESKGLLTNFQLFEMFGVEAKNTMPAGEWIRNMVEKILNPYMNGFMPWNFALPWRLETGDSIAVKHGVVNDSYQSMQGSIYDIMKFHGDVGVWNELYTEDREDGVHVVYRPTPALHITMPEGAKDRKIQDDAPDPVYCVVEDSMIKTLSVGRGDSNIANFYWVSNSRFDMIDDMQRKLAAYTSDSESVYIPNYPNTAKQNYGTRAMYAETQQGETSIANMASGLNKSEQDARSSKMESWIDRRRRHMVEMNRDNVVLETGTATVKGGILRQDGIELMKAGDYARFRQGRMEWDAYVTQIEHDFQPFQGYTTTLHFERGEGFYRRISTGVSPWLYEQATRNGAWV